jgi:hypothetical protein
MQSEIKNSKEQWPISIEYRRPQSDFARSLLDMDGELTSHQEKAAAIKSQPNENTRTTLSIHKKHGWPI